MKESVIENAGLEWLNKQDGVFAFKNPDQRAFINGSYRANPWMPRGIPDITIWSQGRVSYIEFKTPTGKLSKYQQAFMEKGLRMDIQVSICKSLQDVKNFYNSLYI